ncbi:uncharacterized protein LOC111053385 [Nilaparvata lugens]|uniref:uncharacterized protein LOC111053385 n=1 Tax=Nilaparvata lugens TaxID=108931 RepID=UPI00193DC043|nr:uncharacterized protein LOC111053385 [Nilaparvata lugens]
MNNNTNSNQERYPLIEQEWSVHAQLTFTHSPGEEVHVSGGGAGVHPCYGFRRGNIFFTTSPPPPPANYGSLPGSHRRTTQPYNRRCMSTCNIVLGHTSPPPACRHHSTMDACDICAGGGRACRHHSVAMSTDACDICAGGGRSPTSARRAHTFTSHFCTRVPDKTPAVTSSRDAASQTSCASICEKDTLQLPNTAAQGAKRLSRSPARLRGKSPLVNKQKGEPLQSSTDSCCYRKSQKKQQQPPKTVHIDVYCTESEQSGFGSSEGEDSPQTVYENDKMRVVHKREKERLPQAIVRQKRRTLSETSMSSLYPSVRSSTVSVGPSISVCPSSQTNSNSGITSMTSSCALFSDDSLAATSWKDTTTEMESLRQSDISLTKTESFEYEDFADRLRIREKEKKWAACDEGKTWRSPETERKHLLQQQKCQQYVQRRGSPFPRWKPDDSSEESDHSSYSEMAWSFGRLDELTKRISPTVKREDTVKRSCVDRKVLLKRSDSGSLSDSGAVSCSSTRTRDTIGPFGKKPDSPPKHKLDSVVVSPFAPAVTGAESDFLSKARKFGTIVDGFRKPGHHVGPSKNPDCLCENCQRHYKERWLVSRGRARSLGNEASNQRDRLKATLHSVIQSKQPETMQEFAAENDSSCV